MKKALWDGKRKVKLTPRFIRALKELCRAEMDMMNQQGSWACPETWKCSKLILGDMSNSNCIVIMFGEPQDFGPSMKKGTVRIVVE